MRLNDRVTGPYKVSLQATAHLNNERRNKPKQTRKIESLLYLLPMLTEKKFIVFYVPTAHYISSYTILLESGRVDTIHIL